MLRAKQAPQAREAAPLVNITNFASVRENSARSEHRQLRYRRQKEAGRLLPGHDVARCYRQVGADPATGKRREYLEKKISAATGDHYTSGFWRCDSNPCAVCQARRAGVLLDRLLPALSENAHRFAYGMDTLTASSRGMVAGEFVPKLKRALKRFNSGRAAGDHNERWHIRGYVTGQDFTQGEHGPHFHIHRLLIFDRAPFAIERPSKRKLNKNPILAAMWSAYDYFVTAISSGHGDGPDKIALGLMWAEAAQRWVDCCEAEGLIATIEHGYHVEPARKSAAHYIAKLALEVTQPGNKRGKGGLTLGELLDASAAGDRRAGRFWLEAIAALKGTAMLKASPGLWELLGVVEPTEDELSAGDETAIDQLFALLPVDDWYKLLKADLRESYFANEAENSLESAARFAQLAGIRLLPPEAKNTIATVTEAQPGDSGMLAGRIVRVDLDALIGWDSAAVGRLSQGNVTPDTGQGTWPGRAGAARFISPTEAMPGESLPTAAAIAGDGDKSGGTSGSVGSLSQVTPGTPIPGSHNYSSDRQVVPSPWLIPLQDAARCIRPTEAIPGERLPTDPDGGGSDGKLS